MSLAERMRVAADTLEEASRVYDANHPGFYPWTAVTLRHEAEHVETDEASAQCMWCGGVNIDGHECGRGQR